MSFVRIILPRSSVLKGLSLSISLFRYSISATLSVGLRLITCPKRPLLLTLSLNETADGSVAMFSWMSFPIQLFFGAKIYFFPLTSKLLLLFLSHTDHFLSHTEITEITERLSHRDNLKGETSYKQIMNLYFSLLKYLCDFCDFCVTLIFV